MKQNNLLTELSQCCFSVTSHNISYRRPEDIHNKQHTDSLITIINNCLINKEKGIWKENKIKKYFLFFLF